MIPYCVSLVQLVSKTANRRTKKDHQTSRQAFEYDMSRHGIASGVSCRKDQQVDVAIVGVLIAVRLDRSRCSHFGGVHRVDVPIGRKGWDTNDDGDR